MTTVAGRQESTAERKRIKAFFNLFCSAGDRLDLKEDPKFLQLFP